MTLSDTLLEVPKTKIAISLDADIVKVIKRLVADGRADSVSAYIEDALVEYISDDDDAFQAELDVIFDETGGPPTPEELAWADRVLGYGE